MTIKIAKIDRLSINYSYLKDEHKQAKEKNLTFKNPNGLFMLYTDFVEAITDLKLQYEIEIEKIQNPKVNYNPIVDSDDDVSF